MSRDNWCGRSPAIKDSSHNNLVIVVSALEAVTPIPRRPLLSKRLERRTPHHKDTMFLPVAKVASCFATVSLATSRIPCFAYSARSILSTAASATANLSPPPAEHAVNAIHALTSMVQLRGGQAAAAAAAALDLSRESHCITELATYGTLTALVMNSALRLWTSTKFSKEQNSFVSHSFTISTAVCVIAGAFTAILFQLLGIYSKTALGMSNDAGYTSFKMATAIYRKWGFRCFLTELTSFVCSFVISLYNKLWHEAQAHPETKDMWKRVGTYIMTGCILLIVLGTYHIKVVLNLATKHIFIDAYHDKFA